MVKKVTGGSQTPTGSGVAPFAPRGDPPKQPTPAEPKPFAEIEAPSAFLRRMLEAKLEEILTINPLKLPEEYDRNTAQRVIDDGLSQVIDNLKEEIRGLAREAAATPPGLTIPQRSKAVQLSFSQSNTLDRWDTRTLPPSGGKTYSGPGRIWQVTNADVPADFEAGGSVRYRLNLEQVRFGVLGVRFLDNLSDHAMNSGSQTGSPLEVTYGVVVKDVPWFGSEPPSSVLLVDSIGHPVSALHGRQIGSSKPWMSGSAQFAEVKTDGEFNDNSPAPYESLRDDALENATNSENLYEPGESYARDVQGIGVMLITGDTEHQVYSQVNGLENSSTPHVSGFGRGPSASFPPGLEVLPPAVAQYVTSYQSGGGGTAYDSLRCRVLSETLPTDTEPCVGGPAFRWADCGALRLKPQRFSMALSILPKRIIPWESYRDLWQGETAAQGLISYDMHPAAMWTSAVRYRRDGSKSRRNSTLEMVVI